MKHLFLVVSLLFAGAARADSVNQVAQELKQVSVLSLHQNVATWWASNLLTAQANASYASPESLDLSIAAVLKAIGLEQSIAGFNYCDRSNCIWANQQSLVAIDPNAGIVITPNALDFAAPVATPEPGVFLFLIAGLLWLLAIGTKRTATAREYPACHPFRK